MVKRYDGNTGRVTHVEERPQQREPVRRAAPRGAERREEQRMPQQGPPPLPRAQAPRHGLFPEPLQRLLPGVGELETEDLLLMLILYLLYRESGDQDWLVTLGAMLFL